MRWIHTLPEPKDAQAVLNALADIPAEDRLAALMFTGADNDESREALSFLHSLEGAET